LVSTYDKEQAHNYGLFRKGSISFQSLARHSRVKRSGEPQSLLDLTNASLRARHILRTVHNILFSEGVTPRQDSKRLAVDVVLSDFSQRTIDVWNYQHSVKHIQEQESATKIAVVTDPFSRVIRLLSKDFQCPMWGWNSELLRAEVAHFAGSNPGNPRLESSPAISFPLLIAGKEPEIDQWTVVRPDSDIARMLAELWESYNIVEGFRGSCNEKFGITVRKLSKLTSLLERLLVPPQFVVPIQERVWGTISLTRRVDELFATRANDLGVKPRDAQLLNDAIRHAASLAKRIIDYLERKPLECKASSLVKLVESNLGGPPLIISPYEHPLVLATEDYLRAELGDEVNRFNVSIMTPDDVLYSQKEYSGSLLLPGPIPWMYRKLLTAPFDKITVAVYPTEEELLSAQLSWIRSSLAYIPLERMRFFRSLGIRTVSELYAAMSSLYGVSIERIEELSADTHFELGLFRDDMIEVETPPGAPLKEETMDEAIRKASRRYAGTDYEMGLDAERDLDIIIRTHDWDQGHDEEFRDVTCSMMVFENAGCYLFPSRRRLACVTAEEIGYLTTREISRGAHVILVDEGLIHSLTDVILDAIDARPEMKPVVEKARLWRSRLIRQAYGARHRPGDILSRIRALGSKIETDAAVRNWLDQTVIGPADAEDIRRIGTAYNDELLIQNVQDIHNAVDKLRGIHRSIMRALRRVIVSGGVKADSRWEDLGIDINEIWERIRIEIVIVALHDIPVSSGILIGRRLDQDDLSHLPVKPEFVDWLRSRRYI
jgi:hypothetical protein